MLQTSFSAEFEALLRPAERARRLIWAAAAGTILLVIGLAAMLIPSTGAQTDFSADTNASWLAPLHLVAMALAIISLLIRSYGFSDLRLKKIIRASAPDTSESRPRRGTPPTLSEPELRLWRLFEKIMPIQLIGWSVNELVILLGCAAAYFAGRFDAIYPFAFMALVLHVLMFPRFEPFARRMQTLELPFGPVSND